MRFGNEYNARREPSNMYDTNAIAISTAKDVTTGHLRKTVAAIVSPVMLDGRLQVRARVLGYVGSKYRPEIKCNLPFYHTPDECDDSFVSTIRVAIRSLQDLPF